MAVPTPGRLPVVHQLLPSLRLGDAAGAHTLQVQIALREAGFESELFVEHHDEVFAGRVHHYSELGAHCSLGRTALLYQLAIGSKIADMLLDRPEPVIVNYHNLTPAAFFWPWDPGLVEGIVWGHLQLHQLWGRATHAVAVSSFNRIDLDRAGYLSTAVAPPLVDLAGFEGTADPEALARYRSRPGAQWLFVGRLAPNKAAQDLVKALAAYRRVYDPEARLVLVGGQGHPVYTDAVRNLIEALDLVDAVELTGGVSHGELAAAYESSDAFVCLSDHEGFCFPLLEAMAHDLPVVAYGSSAIPETVGTGGVVLAEKSPFTVAAAVHQVLSVPGRREVLAAAGRARLADFELTRTRARMVEEVRRGLVNAELIPGVPSWTQAAREAKAEAEAAEAAARSARAEALALEDR